MHGRTLKIGAGLVAALAICTFVAPSSAFADYAPSSGDVVGVGSDTLQAMTDFAADGSYLSDPGYNGAGNLNKFISIDATADANTRLAYGPGGANGYGTNKVNSSTGALVNGTSPNGCAPGTGSKVGTGNLTTPDTNTADFPCVLAPTVVLRAGLAPEQRPNGSGAGFKLLNADTVQSGTGAGTGIGNGGTGLVNFSRASASQVTNNPLFNSITVGTDNLAILSAAAGTTDAVALSTAQLTAIYNCTATTWTQVGGTSSNTIVPLLPQVGSGTRKVFLAAISVTTPGSCVQNVEENDPLAIQDSGAAADAIEPMSSTRLNLFLGKDGNGNPTGSNGYFQDPTCPFNPSTSTNTGVAGTANAPTVCQPTTTTNTNGSTIAPNVKLWTTGTPVNGTGTGAVAAGSGGIAVTPRNLLIYFRAADINSTVPFQPGGTLNWVRTMFYNPCPVAFGNANFAADHCSHNATTLIDYGPGGAPYFDSPSGQQDISDAGVTPSWAFNGTTQ